MNNMMVVHPVNVTNDHVDKIPNLLTVWGDSKVLHIGKWDRGEPPANLVEVDLGVLYRMFGTDIKIPYEDHSFDHCICTTLHTIPNTYWFVQDIYRVITGQIYIEAPFLTPYSTSKDDLYRFTPRGLAALFSNFRIEDIGIVNGPGSTLHWVKTIYDSLLYERNGTIDRLDKVIADPNYLEAYGIMAMHNEDIKGTDDILNDREHACTIACSLYLLANVT
jgi:hypothetical protein